MIIEFPYYSDLTPLEIPEDRLIGVYGPRLDDDHQTQTDLIRTDLILEGLNNPIASDRISKSVKPGENVVVVCDDNTRPTRADLILPHLFLELQSAGIRKQDICILLALGGHRPMARNEIIDKIGAQIVDEYEVVNHTWDNKQSLRLMGYTQTGVPIWVNKLITEANMVIGVGHIAPHCDVGFGGGCKIILPGVCGEETVVQMHLLSHKLVQSHHILGNIHNPIRQLIDEVGIKVGLKLIANAIHYSDGRLAQFVVGHPIAAHRVGVETSRRLYEVQIPVRADIVIVDSFPADLNYWQAGKGLAAARCAVKDGGIIILISPCTEGICPEHPTWSELMAYDIQQLRSLLENGKIADRMAAIAALETKLVNSSFKCILVSKGLNPNEKKMLGLTHAENPQEAVALAFELLPGLPSITVLRRGGELLPVIK